MKRIICQLILLFCALPVFPALSLASTATVEVVQSYDAYHAGETRPIIFSVHIADGWYIHGDRAGSDEIIPTGLAFDSTSFLKIEDIAFPEPYQKRFEYLSSPIEIFSGDILVRASIMLDNGSPSGTRVIRGRLSYQACSLNSCRPPEVVSVEVSIDIVPDGIRTHEINRDRFPATTSSTDNVVKGAGIPGAEKGIVWTLVLIFLGGLALNLSPCIYPMIPITVSYFGGRSVRMKGDTLIHGLLYLIGLSVTNSLLGVVSALSGSMLGSLLQHPASLIIIALVMTALGLSFFDLWEVRIPAGLNSIASRSFGGYFGTFFMGLTIGIIAAPCIGPFILGLLAYVGQKGDPLFGFLCFFILSMGMGLPICILALFSGAMKRLPLSGDWMVWIRRLMGWVLIAMAAYMIGPLITTDTVKTALFFIIAVSAGIHLGWLDRAGEDRARFRLIKRISGVLIIFLGIACLYPAFRNGEGVRWQPYDEGVLAGAVKEGRPVVLDFYADWCVPCKGLDRTVFRDPEVIGLSNRFVMVRMDLTTRQPQQEEVLERYDVTGVPAIVFINKEGIEERGLRVSSMVDTPEFLSAMRQALSDDR